MRINACFIIVLALVLFSPAQAQKRKQSYDPLELTNLRLGPQYATWLVGPIARLATEAERNTYLATGSDEQAAELIARFWEAPERQAIKAEYDDRKAQADKLYREGAYAGHRTDRGMIFVLYGPPEETNFAEHRDVLDPNVEVWLYAKKSPPGLDGKKPQRRYRFAKQGDLTRFYQPTALDRRRESLERRVRPPNPR